MSPILNSLFLLSVEFQLSFICQIYLFRYQLNFQGFFNFWEDFEEQSFTRDGQSQCRENLHYRGFITLQIAIYFEYYSSQFQAYSIPKGSSFRSYYFQFTFIFSYSSDLNEFSLTSYQFQFILLFCNCSDFNGSNSFDYSSFNSFKLSQLFYRFYTCYSCDLLK